ncbi:MAG: V-type ATP synthase subunit D [Deltaproteobacteria bacterium]|nr:V-type ATP synthase subunit D [Deltaproteobacteria bacterium]
MKADKVKLTRPELKRQRDTLARYERFLPTLKLKHQLLQQSLLDAERDLQRANAQLASREDAVSALRPLNDLPSCIDLEALSTPVDVTMVEKNVAGVKIPLFKTAQFPTPEYSALFTPPYVDALLERLTERTKVRLQRDAEQERWNALRREFARVNQRLNLFEKVVIPKTKSAIHRIRIYLGDEQTAAVGRAKLARTKQLKKRRAARERAVSFGGISLHD